MHKILRCLIPFFFIAVASSAATLHGVVKDSKGEAVPFVNVYLANSTTGTTTNLNGNYFLKLSQGTYQIVFKLMSYKQVTKQIIVGETDIELDITLEDELYALKEINIKAYGEDPAYAIVRKAQSRRKYFLNQVEQYTCNAYVKSNQRILSAPKKFMGQDIDLGSMFDTSTGIFYLSESVSKISFGGEGKSKEEMISSKVSGQPQAYSFNSAGGLSFSVYENNIRIGGIAPRGLISPIAVNALFYYDFKLEGTFVQNGIMVNKIKVTPKRVNDPVLTGYIFIADDSWRMTDVDLSFFKAQSIAFIDTFTMKQTWLPVTDSIWMPFSNTFDYSFSIFVIKGKGQVLNINSEYNIHPEFSEKYFDAEVMKVNTEANKKDSVYWSQNRPVALLTDEMKDYVTKDSIRLVVESKPYLDSIDAKHNKFSAKDLFGTYYHDNSWHKRYWSLQSPVKGIEFNTVQGFNSTILFNYRKFKDDDFILYHKFSQKLNYGLAEKALSAVSSFEKKVEAIHNTEYNIDAGIDRVQYNENNPVSTTVNSIYTLIAEKNYLKLFEKKFALVSASRELFNGLNTKITLSYAERNKLINHSDYVFNDVKDRVYTANNPIFPEINSTLLDSKIVYAELSAEIKPGQKYVTRPEGRYYFGNRWPTIRLHYKKALGASNDFSDFDFAEASVSDQLNLKILGMFKYSITAGTFLTDKKIFFNDYRHFNGNQTIVSNFGLKDFRLLEYYKYSTTASFVEVHAENNFGGFFFNKIPGFRKLKLQEVISLHYLITENNRSYSELSFGIEKLQVLRVEFSLARLPNGKIRNGFLIGLRRQIVI